MAVKVNKDGLTEDEFLRQYDIKKYDRPSVTVDVLIFAIINNKLNILMIKRADHPFIDQWALPGGFVEINESVDQAAYRELKEETDLEDVSLEQFYTWGELGRDPRGRIISVSYITLVEASKVNHKAGDDACDTRWFEVDFKQIDNNVRIYLNSDNTNLYSDISLNDKINNGFKKISRKVVCSTGIAFDHGKIIHYGVEYLKNTRIWRKI